MNQEQCSKKVEGTMPIATKYKDYKSSFKKVKG